ncbi:MAG TPA: hypothetical protein VGW38_17770, partial [Chloroflexota bacterium]|nr:hypothetical protein [Chloroflexota bacterium]
LNVPQRVVGELGSGDTERSFAALKQVVVAHNGWADDEGTPYPAADTESFWESVMGNGLAGIHLISCIVRGIRDAAANAGNSPRPTRPQ